jgi:hypothetical protein
LTNEKNTLEEVFLAWRRTGGKFGVLEMNPNSWQE